MEKPRVGLDARCGRRISDGMATAIREVVRRLPAVAPEFEYEIYAKGENLGLSEQIALPLAMRRDRIALAHYMAHYVPYFASGRFVVTIYDLIHLRYKRFFRAYIEPYYRTVVRKAVRNAAFVITNDRKTVGDLVHFFDIAPEKVRVIPLAAREAFLEPVEPHRAPRPYLLHVGNHRRHKDLPTLLRAWRALPPEYEVDLYLTGADDLGPLAGDGDRHGSRRRLVFLGRVDDRRLAAYYAGAVALVQSSLLEGFGLPIAEAMAVGCPVIATETALPEVLAGAARAFPAGDVEALRVHLQQLMDDSDARTVMIERGRSTARALSWERTARLIADVYAEALDDR